MRRKRLLILAILLAITLLGISASHLAARNWESVFYLIKTGINPAILEKTFRHPDLVDSLLLLAMTILMAAIPLLSTSLIGVVNGVVFGSGLGFGMNWLGSIIGNTLVLIFLSRFGLSDKAAHDNRLTGLLGHIKSPILALALGYLVPLIPSFIVSDTALHMTMAPQKRFFSIVIGTLPSSILYAYGGDAVFHMDKKEMTVLAIVAVVLFLFYEGVAYLSNKKVVGR